MAKSRIVCMESIKQIEHKEGKYLIDAFIGFWAFLWELSINIFTKNLEANENTYFNSDILI